MTAAVHPAAPPLLVVVSIDTEEDNWEPSRNDIRVTNIAELPTVHRLLERFGVRPTYFTSYQVASVEWAAGILSDLSSDGRAEIGAHLHPWNTPPARELFVPRNTVMKNLSGELQAAKLRELTALLATVFGSRPTSFRAGRYGMGALGMRAISEQGYTVDSSVTPFLDWRRFNDGPDFRDAPLEAYHPSFDDITIPTSDGPIVELPLSVGYTRRPFASWHHRHEQLLRSRAGPLSLASLAYRTHLLRKVQLSFETDTVNDMLMLTRLLLLDGARFIHITWHSPSLVSGLSPFVSGSAERDRFRANMEQYFDRLAGIQSFSFATVSEAAERLIPRATPETAYVGSC